MAKRQEFTEAEAAVQAKVKCMYCNADAPYTANFTRRYADNGPPLPRPTNVCLRHARHLQEEFGACTPWNVEIRTRNN